MSYCFRILHIADPHFKNCHFSGSPEEVGKRHAREVIESLEAESLKNHHKPLRPFDALVLSGDFTFACHPEGFRAAEFFIHALMEHQIDSHQPLVRENGLIVIPGNHDIDLSTPVVIKNLTLPTSKEDSEIPFRQFLKNIEHYVAPPNHCLSMVRRIKGNGDAKDRGLVIIALNSCRAERRDAQGWGYVGADQIHAAASALLSAPPDKGRAERGDIVIAVMHHNPLPIWDLGLSTLGHVPHLRKFSFMMDAGGTFSFLADLGVSLILHGHTHTESVKFVGGYATGSGSRVPALVLGCGSLGIKYSGVEPIPVHHFQVIEIEVGSGKDDVLLRYQDFKAPFRSPGKDREWTSMMSEYQPIYKTNAGKEKFQLGVPWDPQKVESLLKAKEFECNGTAYVSEVMESWSVLRIRQLKPAEWPRVLAELCKGVQKIAKSAEDKDIIAAVERIFDYPPPETTMCLKTLEQYLIECLARPSA